MQLRKHSSLAWGRTDLAGGHYPNHLGLSGTEGFPGQGTISANVWKVLGKPGWVGHPRGNVTLSVNPPRTELGQENKSYQKAYFSNLTSSGTLHYHGMDQVAASECIQEKVGRPHVQCAKEQWFSNCAPIRIIQEAFKTPLAQEQLNQNYWR